MAGLEVKISLDLVIILRTSLMHRMIPIPKVNLRRPRALSKSLTQRRAQLRQLEDLTLQEARIRKRVRRVRRTKRRPRIPMTQSLMTVTTVMIQMRTLMTLPTARKRRKRPRETSASRSLARHLSPNVPSQPAKIPRPLHLLSNRHRSPLQPSNNSNQLLAVTCLICFQVQRLAHLLNHSNNNSHPQLLVSCNSNNLFSSNNLHKLKPTLECSVV